MRKAILTLLVLSSVACSVELGVGVGTGAQQTADWAEPDLTGQCAQHAFTPERPLGVDITDLVCIDDWGDRLALGGWLAVQPTVPVGQEAAYLWQCGNDVALEYAVFGPLVQDCAVQLYELGCQWGAADSPNTALELCYHMIDMETASGLPAMRHEVVASDECQVFEPLAGCI